MNCSKTYLAFLLITTLFTCKKDAKDSPSSTSEGGNPSESIATTGTLALGFPVDAHRCHSETATQTQTALTDLRNIQATAGTLQIETSLHLAGDDGDNAPSGLGSRLLANAKRLYSAKDIKDCIYKPAELMMQCPLLWTFPSLSLPRTSRYTEL